MYEWFLSLLFSLKLQVEVKQLKDNKYRINVIATSDFNYDFWTSYNKYIPAIFSRCWATFPIWRLNSAAVLFWTVTSKWEAEVQEAGWRTRSKHKSSCQRNRSSCNKSWQNFDWGQRCCTKRESWGIWFSMVKSINLDRIIHVNFIQNNF